MPARSPVLSAPAARRTAVLLPALARSSRLARSAVLAAALALGGVATAPAAHAQQQPAAGVGLDGNQPNIENSKFQFRGMLVRAEFVRALPAERYYATQRLDKGAEVIVVGVKGDWLKIVPPEGSFSYVNKALVQRFGGGKQGRVTSANLLVKAGSSLHPVMWIQQASLQPSDTVEILGEDEQYFKIKPPAGAYLYLPKAAVAAKEPVSVPEAAPPERVAEAPPVPRPQSEVAAGPVRTETPLPGGLAPLPGGPATVPTADAGAPAEPEVTAEGSSANPTTRPLSAAEAVEQLRGLEARFADASKRPLAEQPLADLVADYERVGSAAGVADTTKRVVEIRLATLKVRTEALEHLRTTQAQQRAAAEKLAAQQAERAELEQQLKKVELQRFTAVGTLRPSSLQVARTPLFRLTDPANGRTLAYVWGTTPTVGKHLDQFVGVRGEVQTDGRLQFKVINPAAVETVDPAKLATVYAAELVPPSLLPRVPVAPPTAGTDPQAQ